MGAQRGDDEAEALPVVAERLFAKAGFEVDLSPKGSTELCCGQPFESKGLFEAADRKSAELEAALRDASEDGRLPIVFDTSPCTYRMRRYLAGRLPVQDSIEFIHDRVLPRVDVEPIDLPVAIHPVCSVRKMGTVDKLAAIAARCSREVVHVDEVLCCGFAGDKGFNRPELNEHALRHLKAALSGAVRARLFVESNLRDRPVGVFGLSLPIDHPSRRRVRERARLRAPMSDPDGSADRRRKHR